MNDTTMEEKMTVSEFLKSVCQLVTAEGIQFVCAKRKLKPTDVYEDLSERDADLAEGTMYYWLASLPVGGGTEKVADGGWSHSEGGWQVSKANIEEWSRRYRALFDKWDEPLIGNSRIRIINF